MNGKNGLSSVRFGEVYVVYFEGQGSVQRGIRPGLIFQNNMGNRYSPNVIVLPLTTSVKKSNLPTHVFVSAKDTGLLKDSIVLCENPECISKEQLGDYITTLPNKYMSEIAKASILATAAISYVKVSELESLWDYANRLNTFG